MAQAGQLGLLVSRGRQGSWAPPSLPSLQPHLSAGHSLHSLSERLMSVFSQAAGMFHK